MALEGSGIQLAQIGVGRRGLGVMIHQASQPLRHTYYRIDDGFWRRMMDCVYRCL